MKMLFPFLALLLIAAGNSRYDRCIATASKNPQAAYDMASSWRAEGGGVASMHCQGMALIHLGQPARGAGVLDAAAEKMENVPVIAADMYAQAGNAWLLAADVRRAIARFTSALHLLPEGMPQRSDIFIDRARSHAQLEDKQKALADLSAALELSPAHVDARLLRAELYLSLGDAAKARADLSAIKAVPMEADKKALFARLSQKAEE